LNSFSESQVCERLCLAHHPNDDERYCRASSDLKADAEQGQFGELGQKADSDQSQQVLRWCWL
jgi:hypothetical protein